MRCYLARVTTKQSNIDGCCRPNLRCEECLKVSFMDLLEEYKKPVKLTKFEYEYLKFAKENEYNFIARDKNNNLYLYSNKPWKDEEPYSIDEILSNCEVMQDE